MRILNTFFLSVLFCVVTTGGFAQTPTGADFMTAMKKANVNVVFDVNSEGEPFRVKWGMDTAWDWDWNVTRGVNYYGKGLFETGRISFQPNDLVVDNGDGTYTLSERQQKELKWRCDLIKRTGTKEVNINCDHEALFANDDFTGKNNYQGKPKEWYRLIKASVQYAQAQGLKVVSVSPFNEPDYVWQQARDENQAMKDFLEIAKLIKADPFFDDIRICGGNTLNCDRALPWYNYLSAYLDEGNTHQLAGSFDTYADFFAKVKADGKVATADELHNVGEAMVGVNYGMTNGIWWGFDSRARGQFMHDSNEGVRLAYAENRGAWTDAAVYRNESTGEVHGYFGSSERQAVASSFAYVSKGKDVYFNGYGPTRMYVYDVPGGKSGSYQKGQINAERVFDITWGEDVAPSEINGTYQIMNASSKKLMTYNGTGNVTSKSRATSGTTQQWKVCPGYTDGDVSYWFIDNANSNTAETKVNLNVLNNNLNAGAGVICWDAGHGAVEQWYLKYVKDGYYFIISRLSNKYLYCGSSTNGETLKLQNPPSATATDITLKRYLWRFMPVDAEAEAQAPDAPVMAEARRRAGSIELTWTAPADNDPLTYNIIRGEVNDEDGEVSDWNTIGRNDAMTSFVDNTALVGKKYAYKVVAVDYAGNRSVGSNVIEASLLDEKALLCQIQFDGNLDDNSANALHATSNAALSYTSNSAYVKSGEKSGQFTGSAYAMLPYSVADRDEMTITTWMRWGTTSNWQRVFDFGNDETQYMFFTPSNGSEMRFVMKDKGAEQILSSGKKLAASVWKHVAITLKPLAGGNVRVVMYIDGEKVAESEEFTIKPSDIKPSLCFIGRSMFNADPLFNGRLDDFRIYNYALTQEQVKAVMADTDVVSKDINDSYEDIETGILQTKRQDASAGDCYDISGRRISAPVKGISINNGKKEMR